MPKLEKIRQIFRHFLQHFEEVTMKQKVFTIFIFCLLITFPCLASAAANTGNVDFWLSRLPSGNSLIMSPGEIAVYNREMLGKLSASTYDLTKLPASIPSQKLLSYMQETDFPDGYVNGQKMTYEFKHRVLANMNTAAIQAHNTVSWGLAVKRASLRAYPTATGIFDSADDTDFDDLQNTIVNPGEALAIFFKSADGNWFFVQSSTYRGWISADSVAETSYAKWLNWQTRTPFLIVIAPELSLETGAGTVPAEMGSRLPVAGKDGNHYIVELPVRQTDGQAAFIHSTIPVDANVSLGYLPYTRANIIRQAFRFYGRPYGWGGLKDSVDCSSFIMDIYRCFGFTMPRDADTQEVKVGKVTAVSPANVEAVLDRTLPGATLHMDGHVMLYLGHIADQYYVINSLGSYGDSHGGVGSDGLLPRVPVMQVTVTEIKHTLRRNGQSFMNSLRTVKEWEY
jgi:cell wall-associated NlpC family hydrolase